MSETAPSGPNRQTLGMRESPCETGPVMRIVRRGALAGTLAGVGFAIWKYLSARTPDTAGVRYEPQPFPMPPRPVPPAPPVPAHGPELGDALGEPEPWVPPDEGGNCPASHPIKGKRSSGIYHQPGSFAYDRTHADRCYLNTAAAENDTLRAAKR